MNRLGFVALMAFAIVVSLGGFFVSCGGGGSSTADSSADTRRVVDAPMPDARMVDAAAGRGGMGGMGGGGTGGTGGMGGGGGGAGGAAGGTGGAAGGTGGTAGGTGGTAGGTGGAAGGTGGTAGGTGGMAGGGTGGTAGGGTGGSGGASSNPNACSFSITTFEFELGGSSIDSYGADVGCWTETNNVCTVQRYGQCEATTCTGMSTSTDVSAGVVTLDFVPMATFTPDSSGQYTRQNFQNRPVQPGTTKTFTAAGGAVFGAPFTVSVTASATMTVTSPSSPPSTFSTTNPPTFQYIPLPQGQGHAFFYAYTGSNSVYCEDDDNDGTFTPPAAAFQLLSGMGAYGFQVDQVTQPQGVGNFTVFGSGLSAAVSLSNELYAAFSATFSP